VNPTKCLANFKRKEIMDQVYTPQFRAFKDQAKVQADAAVNDIYVSAKRARAEAHINAIKRRYDAMVNVVL